MQIDDYLAREGINAAEFAVRIGLSAASLSRIRRGEQMPGRDTLQRIFDATGGDVSPNEVIGIRLLRRRPVIGAGGMSGELGFNLTASGPDLAPFELFLRSVSDILEATGAGGERSVEVCLEGRDVLVDGFAVAVVQVNIDTTAGAWCVSGGMEPGEGMAAFVAAFTAKLDGKVAVVWHDGWPILSLGDRAPSVAEAGAPSSVPAEGVA